MIFEEDFDDPDDDILLEEEEDGDDGGIDDDNNPDEEFVELDPTGRYGRYAEVLGMGATKTVYKAYDMVDCKEVAWNKAKANTLAEGPEALAIEREIILLQRLTYRGIIKLYNAWVDEKSGDNNFITELCSSTLLAFRLKHKHVSRKAVKSWVRQILECLVYLHSQDPPIIHRDIKCENIFVKSSSSTVIKIGDFGSATILNETHHMHTLVGTPEFMAPEMYKEDYDELVDVYSFGMCVLELITRECPYAECISLAQIYKQVTNGKKPRSLLKVKDAQALQFINRCLLPACKRPSAKELLDDPFLQHKDVRANWVKPTNSVPSLKSFTRSVPGKLLFGDDNVSKVALPCGSNAERISGSTETNVKVNSMDFVSKDGACSAKDTSMSRCYQVMGTKEDENTLQLRICIQESSHCSNIVFPFNLRSDTPKSVAEEMVRTLNYPPSDMPTIADLISEELAVLALTSDEDLALPTCSEKFSGSKRQTDNLPVCVAVSSGNADFDESNAPSEEIARGSQKGLSVLVRDEENKEIQHDNGSAISILDARGSQKGLSVLVRDEENKEIQHDNGSAISILDANSGVLAINESFREFAFYSSGELRRDEIFPTSTTLASDVKTNSSLAKRSGALHGKSSSIAAHNKRSRRIVFKNSRKILWRPPSEPGFRRRRPLYVNIVA